MSDDTTEGYYMCEEVCPTCQTRCSRPQSHGTAHFCHSCDTAWGGDE